MDQNGFGMMEFSSDEEMISYLLTKADDIEKLNVLVANDLLLSGPEGQKVILRNRCATLKLVSGRSIVVPTEVLQKVLDQGVLQRLRVPITLIPQEAR